MKKNKLLASVFLFSSLSFCAAVPSQWRGPARDGHFPATGLLEAWPESGPALILEVESIGQGYSSPVYDDGTIYTTGMIDSQDCLTAILPDGTFKWQKPYGNSWKESFPDTRSSPVIEGKYIYVQSGTGEVSCLDKESGEQIWAVNVDETFGAEYHVWGNSETPLIVDDLLICTPGGNETSVIALNKLTGEFVWQSECVGGARSYASATIYEYQDLRYILAMTGMEIMALEPATGEIAWHYRYFDSDKWKWQKNGLIWTNTPVFKDNCFFITMGYDYPAVMLEMDPSGTSVKEKFIDHTLDNHHHGVVLLDGYLYGSNWTNNKNGNWVCMDWDTGEIMYETKWDTKGAVVEADDMLYCFNERGNVGLVRPDPSGFQLVSEFRIRKGSGPYWAHPAISDDGKLLLRHGDVLMVYDIKAK